MDCSKRLSNPPSIIPLLYQQFQEQSSVCDVIIKVGLWEKRFHWCVLVASPFFEAIHRNNFLEKQTGIIELNKWPASLVEHSLLFLYGRQPNVTEANVDTLLDIAEFLLIPELKVACIEFLKKTKVTLDNCVQLLELSDVCDDMALETIESFILGNLLDVLEQKRMLNATTETVKMLLIDPTLSYVPVQNWFTFIIRWVKEASERQCEFVELFHMLDFGDFDSEFINNIVAKEPLVMKNKEELDTTLPTGVDDRNDTVILFENDADRSLACLNLRTMLWYRIDIAIDNNNDDICQFRNTRIDGVKNSSSSYIYKVNITHNSCNVLTHNLSNGHSSVSNVIIRATGDDVDDSLSTTHSIANNTVALCSNTERNVPSKTDLEETLSLDTSTLYIGKLIGLDTDMHAIFTLQNHAILTMCCGANGSIAMLSFDRDNLFIFNEPTGELECIQLKTSFGIKFRDTIHLACFKDGFVLHDKNHVVCISRLSGASLKTAYLVKQLTREIPDASIFFDGNRWFRFRYKYNRFGYKVFNSDASLEYVNHDDLISIEDTALLPWTNIPLPSILRRMYTTCRDEVFAVSLPKGITRCHWDCPHCKLLKDVQPQNNWDKYTFDASYKDFF